MSDEDFDLKKYDALLERLFLRFPSYQKVGGKAYHPGLEDMREIDSRLGHPHRRYRTIHVAGTNGKGSVCNMLASALSATGRRVGLYTSPHLLDFRERARIVGEGLIPRHYVMEFCTRLWPTFDELDLSFFEITTAMALQWFADEKVDFAVIETGLGGRLDSTNIITPSLSVITNIGLDHCNILGDTLAKIAAEKAGIIKKGVPVVVGESGRESDPVFTAKASESGSEIHFADRTEGDSEIHFADRDFPDSFFRPLLDSLDLKGCYQEKNLRTALAALAVLHDKGITPIPATDSRTAEALRHTAERTGFRGRWEKVCDSTLTIADIGHNAHGMKYNFAQLEKMAEDEGYELIIVYGSVADKDYGSVIRMIPRRAKVIFTNASGSRALPSDKARAEFDAEAEVRHTVAEAVSLAQELAATCTKPLIYIGGSSYVVAEALPCLSDGIAK